MPNNHSNVDFNQSADTSDDGNHTHKISGGGDAETRPKNIYVNYIIKYK